MQDIGLLDMLQHGVHFGHQQSRRHPKMDQYIFATRGGVSIINLEQTRTALTQAATFVCDTVAAGGTVLFVGTKRQAREIIRASAQAAGMPYVVDRWIGGLFTNFGNVRELIRKLHTLKENRASGDWNKYTKKEQLDLQEEVDRLEKMVGGLGSMEKLPTAIFVVDVKNDKTAVREAQRVKLPILAICDTNVNPAPITYPIPANDDATKSINFICQVMQAAVQEGRELHDQRMVAVAREAAAIIEAKSAAVTA